MVTHGGYLYGLQVGCGSVIMPRVRSESMGRVHVNWIGVCLQSHQEAVSVI